MCCVYLWLGSSVCCQHIISAGTTWLARHCQGNAQNYTSAVIVLLSWSSSWSHVYLLGYR